MAGDADDDNTIKAVIRERVIAMSRGCELGCSFGFALQARQFVTLTYRSFYSE